MTHYRMLDRAPSVMITSNRNELKLYQGNLVYLNNGDNFELRFFNPLQEKIGVEIIFNGVKKGDSYLVLNPGQDIILDRFLDEQRKMLFETYVVNGDSQEALEAIQKNGLIKFNFYKEYYRRYQNNQSEVNVTYDFPPKPSRSYNSSTTYTGFSGTSGASGVSGTSGAYGVSGTFGNSGVSGTFGNSGVSGNFKKMKSANSNSRIYNSSTTDNVFYSTTTNVYTSPGVYVTETDYSTLSNTAGMGSLTTNCMTTQLDLETGRIEAGELSNQQLKTVNAQFDSTPFHSITYQILPYSAMNRTIGEVRQYCTGCGYRIRKESWHYCPKCGEELQ